MHIAIVGAGFLGLACSWHALQIPNVTVSLIDAKGIGCGASGVAAGLLHSFQAHEIKKIPNADGHISETLKLFEVASGEIGEKIYRQTGMFRPKLERLTEEEYIRAVSLYPDCHLFEEGKACRYIPEIDPVEGLFITSSYQIDCPSYLEGLFRALAKKGATLEIAQIDTLDALSEYDVVILACGAGLKSLGQAFLPKMTLIKGQVLGLQTQSILPFAVNGKAYLVQTQKEHVIAGSTYEKDFCSEEADLEACEKPIRTNIRSFSEAFSKKKVLFCKAGVRVATADHKPFIKQIRPWIWCVGGLGSRGLLQHAYLAKECISQIKQAMLL